MDNNMNRFDLENEQVPSDANKIAELENLEKKVKSGRGSLLAIWVFSLINIALLLLKVEISFLFSAAAPTILASIGTVAGEETGSMLFFIVFAVLAVAVVVFYALLWWLSKKKPSAALVATIAFAIDTLLLAGLILLDVSNAVSYLLDIAFHVWAMVSLVGFVKANKQLKAFKEVNEIVPIQE